MVGQQQLLDEVEREKAGHPVRGEALDEFGGREEGEPPGMRTVTADDRVIPLIRATIQR